MGRLVNFFMKNSERARISLSAIINIILVSSIIYSIYFHLWRILFVNLLLLFLVLMPYTIHRRSEVRIPKEFELIILIFVLFSFFLGDYRGFVIQIFFGLAVAFFGFIIMLVLFYNSKIKINYFLIIIFSFSISVTLGLGLEVLKFYLKWFINDPLKIDDYIYAMRSLTLVSIGAFFASIFGFLYMKGYRPRFVIRVANSFKKRNPNLFIERTDSPEEVLKLIKEGENERAEFKSTLRTNLHTNDHDRRIEHSVLKTIAGFLNSEGGCLLIGVDDERRILGIERDRFQNNDRFMLHFTNLIKEHIGSEYLPYLNFELILVEEKTILKIECLHSSKPVFLKFGKEDEFYIRIGPSSVQLNGRRLVEYIDRKFKE